MIMGGLKANAGFAGRAAALAACVAASTCASASLACSMSSFTKTEAGRDFALSMQAMKRLVGPDDIARTIAFLASDEARWIAGDTVRVDGGSKL